MEPTSEAIIIGYLKWSVSSSSGSVTSSSLVSSFSLLRRPCLGGLAGGRVGEESGVKVISSSEPVPELESELELTKIGVGMLGVGVVLLAIVVVGVVPKSRTLVGVPKDRAKSIDGIERKGMGVGGESSWPSGLI